VTDFPTTHFLDPGPYALRPTPYTLHPSAHRDRKFRDTGGLVLYHTVGLPAVGHVGSQRIS